MYESTDTISSKIFDNDGSGADHGKGSYRIIIRNGVGDGVCGELFLPEEAN